MTELFIHEKEKPKCGYDCDFYDEATFHNISHCALTGKEPKDCPLKSIEEHDKEVKKQARLELLQQMVSPLSSFSYLSTEEARLVEQYNLQLKRLANRSLLNYVFDEADSQDLGEFNGHGWIFPEEYAQKIRVMFLGEEADDENQ